jgi:hypothetical protein
MGATSNSTPSAFLSLSHLRIRVWNLVSHINSSTHTDSVWKQSTEGICGPNRDKIIKTRENYIIGNFKICTHRILTQKRMRCTKHVVHKQKIRPRERQVDNINGNFKETGY